MNIKLLVAYDGTAYLGWQKTPEGPSIEESLQRVLEKILQHPIVLQAASRTDAGVHAHGQVVNFFTEKNMTLDRLQISLNQLLSPDIVIRNVEEERLDFHPTLDCRQKEYHYFICKGRFQMPEHRFYSWHCPWLNQIEDIKQAAQNFVGRHDFSAFCNFRKQLDYTDYIREIDAIDIEEINPDRLVIKVRGANFLYRMVRNIVGTLAYVGMGKIDAAKIPEIISSQDRTRAGITAPAHGLFLHQVFYTP